MLIYSLILYVIIKLLYLVGDFPLHHFLIGGRKTPKTFMVIILIFNYFLKIFLAFFMAFYGFLAKFLWLFMANFFLIFYGFLLAFFFAFI